MVRNSGGSLMVAGLIVAFIGLCIVLVRALQVSPYWIPVMVGIGIFLLGLVRWLGSRRS
jgi:hypothetical protein